MLNDYERRALLTLLSHFLDHAGRDLQKDLPMHYIVLRSAQNRLRDMKPFQEHAH